MTKTIIVKPLGLVLRKAGLVSSEQVETALKESLILPKCKLGEILAIRGLIKPETADFFAETWPRILSIDSNNTDSRADLITVKSTYPQARKFSSLTSANSPNAQIKANANLKISANSDRQLLSLAETSQEPTEILAFDRDKITTTKQVEALGQYLKAAGLIEDRQIIQILKIQQRSGFKFGKIAVDKKIISQTTLEFFLEHLNLIKTEEKIRAYPENIALELDRIESYLLKNQRCSPVKLLQKYGEIGQQGSIIASGDLAEKELIASGLVTLTNNIIRVAKPTYIMNFDREWLEKELAHLQPYNQIRLKMFDLDSKAGIPYKILNAVNYWTNHQPFLTQKLYLLIQEKLNYIHPGQEEKAIEELTYEYIIDNWENKVAAEHFERISDRIMQNKNCSPYAILKAYKKIWQLKKVNADNSLEQRELLRMGLIELNHNRVSVSNLIYQIIFDRQWIKTQFELATTLDNPIKNKLLNHQKSDRQNNYNLEINKYILPVVGILIFLTTVWFLGEKINLSSEEQNIREQNNLIIDN